MKYQRVAPFDAATASDERILEMLSCGLRITRGALASLLPCRSELSHRFVAGDSLQGRPLLHTSREDLAPIDAGSAAPHAVRDQATALISELHKHSLRSLCVLRVCEEGEVLVGAPVSTHATASFSIAGKTSPGAT